MDIFKHSSRIKNTEKYYRGPLMGFLLNGMEHHNHQQNPQKYTCIIIHRNGSGTLYFFDFNQ